MFNQFALNHFLKLAESFARITIHQEFLNDQITPISAYYALVKDYPDIALLESAEKNEMGKYSYLCLQPFDEFRVEANEYADPFAALRKKLAVCDYYNEHPLCRYAGGAVGFVSYDAIRFVENIPDANPSSILLPKLFFKFYRVCIAFDHENNQMVIAVAVDVKNIPKEAYQNALQEINQIITKLNSVQSFTANHESNLEVNHATVNVDVEDDQFMQMVKTAQQYIIDGDIFQVVLSRTFLKPYTADPFNVYRALRITNPSPYMFYLRCGDVVIAGASPERLVSVKNQLVETNPIAGTKLRGTTRTHDLEIEQELQKDEKELAEHMMLVDLGRNDLGKVCLPGSVKVPQLKGIQKLSKVMHLTSTVIGKLDPSKDPLDAIKATFPAGTLSGAPKIRAMEIIDELESSKRELYGGAICIVDSHQNLDACIAIRMAILKDGIAYVRTGAGVVLDSNPAHEAAETRHKAAAVLSAIDLAKELT